MHLPSLAMDMIQMSAKLLLVLAIFVPLERLFAARRQRMLRRAFWTDIAYYFVGGLIPKLLLILPLSLLAWALHRAMPGGYYAGIGALPLWPRLAAAIVVGDLGYYWAHRLMHTVPALWRFHAIHHQAEEMDWLVNTRGHPIDIFFGRFCSLVPLYVLGLAQPLGTHADVVPLFVALVGSLWGFFIHANLRWRFGWLEGLIATPGFHHWHHTNDGPAVQDKNFAAMLPWMDGLFGTLHLPPALPVAYGISEQMPPGIVGQLTYPLQRRPPVLAPASAE